MRLTQVLTFGVVPILAITACFEGDITCENQGTGKDCRGDGRGQSGGGVGGAGTGGTGGFGGTAGAMVNGGSDAGGIGGGTAGANGGQPSAGTGGDGGSDTAGSGGRLPCDGMCKGTKAVCDVEKDTCVQCTAREHCTGTRRACDMGTHTCVACTENTDCSGDKGQCDLDAHTCVECLKSEHCMEETASRCADRACRACMVDDDCEHIDGKGACDAGTCVECTAANETACGANSCNPATKKCTSTPRGSVPICRPCLADSECLGGDEPDPDARCVQMEFQGVPRPAGFCLRRGAKTCGRPYMIPISASSLSGAIAEDYCGIDQVNVRCEAVLDLLASRTCVGGADTLCGCNRDVDGNCVETGKGGLCRDFTLADDKCTYRCGTADDCPDGRTCAGAPTMHCQ